MRIVILIVVVSIVGCASSRDEWRPNGYYITDKDISGCMSYLPAKREPYNRSAIPSIGLIRDFIELLNQAAKGDKSLASKLATRSNELMCWYELPDEALRLRIGNLCTEPLEIEFRQDSQHWVISKVEEPFVSCFKKR